MTDPEMGELDSAVAAELEAAGIRHRLDVAELEEAFSYRDVIVARAAERMRFRLCSDAEVEQMVSECLAAAPCVWIAALRERDDLGTWHD